jgi:chromosome segregation ATPase
LVANVRTNASMVSQLGQHLATGISDLSVRTEQQAASLEETSSSVTELAETVQKNAKSAQAVDELAHDLSNLAESSGGTMNSAVETMESIQSSAREVQEIVGIIDGIAFQTNILALNAAVEAARAGEQGKGFAVVATEVRDLAQRSATSARQIRRLIDESVNRVEAGVSLIGEVSETLADIVAGIRELAANVASISSASVNQSAGLAHISEAVQELDEITQRNGKMADQAKGVAVTLEERAKHLADAVATFKLRQGTADEAFTLTRKAVGLYKVQGPRALKTITADEEKKYADRDMYVFAFDREGKYHAFAGNSSKLGVSLLEVKGLDGRKLVDDAFAVPEGGGWVNYTIPNPISNKIESKSSFIEKVEDDLVMGCGVYKIS